MFKNKIVELINKYKIFTLERKKEIFFLHSNDKIKPGSWLYVVNLPINQIYKTKVLDINNIIVEPNIITDTLSFKNSNFLNESLYNQLLFLTKEEAESYLSGSVLSKKILKFLYKIEFSKQGRDAIKKFRNIYQEDLDYDDMLGYFKYQWKHNSFVEVAAYAEIIGYPKAEIESCKFKFHEEKNEENPI